MSTTRRGLIAGAGAAAIGGAFLLREPASPQPIDFYGEHQAGIATPAQDRLVFAAFDLTLSSAAELRDLLRTWSAAAAAMTRGERAGREPGTPDAPPTDTGEAVGLKPASLTMTFGLGPDVFAADRFGLESRRPSPLTPIGPLPGDQLDPDRSGGDLCVQACADDPQVAFHAVRNLARIGRGSVVLRWTQLGFGRTSSVTSDQATARNLQGFKDGTNNLHGDDDVAMKRFVWVGDDEPQRWMRGGTYLVARRIRMLIEAWDRASLTDQEATIGRFKQSGAPLTGRHERDSVDLAASGPDGTPVIAANAHIRLAGSDANNGARILRRGYSFTDGTDPRTGELDAGLFFIAFQRDPHKQFATIQRGRGRQDALNEYIKHVGSGLFAVPPGARRGGFVGDGLFA
jgi:deferrochelatase/peroxidase EfeB